MLKEFSDGEIHFLEEQVGMPENKFKAKLVELFHAQKIPLRAYLVRVRYESITTDFNVAICLAIEYREDKSLIEGISKIFSEMFGYSEHLDIIFISKTQEIQLRRVSCPFFSSKRFKHPDFYLTSSEITSLGPWRACYKEKRLLGDHQEGYMLCSIEPPIIGQPYGLGDQDIQEIILANRHDKHSIFVVREWPVYVHLARLLRNIPTGEFLILEKDIKSIGWGEIHDSKGSGEADCDDRV